MASLVPDPTMLFCLQEGGFHDSGGIDLYDDVITAPANEESTDEVGKRPNHNFNLRILISRLVC